VAHVVVDVEEVYGGRDEIKVVVLDKGEVADRLVILKHVHWVGAPEERIEEETVSVSVDPAGRRCVFRVFGGWMYGREVQGDAELVVQAAAEAPHTLQRYPRWRVRTRPRPPRPRPGRLRSLCPTECFRERSWLSSRNILVF
jgi:hypothetical protein